jgi:hypothetical protein
MLSFNESILNFNKTILEFNGTMLNANIVNANTTLRPSVTIISVMACVCFMGCILGCKLYICTYEEPVQATIDIIPLPETSHVIDMDYAEEYDFVPESTPVKRDTPVIGYITS